MKYKINEIFESIQGEGSYSGTLVNFVRFAKCNMKCSFCDTEFDKFTELTEEQILAELNKGTSMIVVFTGGEPMLQLDQHLIDYLKEAGYSIHIETNGSIDIFLQGIKHIVVSPKDPARWNVKAGGDLKILIGEDDESMPLESIYLDTRFKNYFLQPIMSPRYEEALANCLTLIKGHPRWKLSIQLHKIINVK